MYQKLGFDCLWNVLNPQIKTAMYEMYGWHALEMSAGVKRTYLKVITMHFLEFCNDQSFMKLFLLE